MIKKILFITLLANGEINGGFVTRKANCSAFAAIVGEENIDVVTSEDDNSEWPGKIVYRIKYYQSISEKIRNLVQGNTTQISNRDIDTIGKLIENNNYDLIVLGCSESGKLIKEIKKYDVKILTFYQDIIAEAVKIKKLQTKSILYSLIARREVYSEKLVTYFSDRRIVLTERDNKMLYKNWKVWADDILPIVVSDNFCESEKTTEFISDKLQLLFVGSFGWGPNVEGIKWFCRNVMPMVSDSILTIAGFGTENLKKETDIALMNNVKIVGTVDCLTKVYAAADVIVSPILNGTGMKTKTAEALMHGKIMLGTNEAWIGYTNLLDDYICNTDKQFIDAIKVLEKNRPKRFNQNLRKIYLDNYSDDANIKNIRKVLQEMDL